MEESKAVFQGTDSAAEGQLWSSLVCSAAGPCSSLSQLGASVNLGAMGEKELHRGNILFMLSGRGNSSQSAPASCIDSKMNTKQILPLSEAINVRCLSRRRKPIDWPMLQGSPTTVIISFLGLFLSLNQFCNSHNFFFPVVASVLITWYMHKAQFCQTLEKIFWFATYHTPDEQFSTLGS